jgi:threonine dehydrogenase-like Zn-dependent dehydrogenase
MLALRVKDGSAVLEDVAVPHTADEALVRVLLSGICNTDLEIIRGYAGFSGTVGHEFVGQVESCPDDPSMVGRRVVGEINAGCGNCSYCMSGDSRHCPQRTVLGIVNRDGCHAESLTLPTRNLIPLPDTVSDEKAVFAEPLAAAFSILEQVTVGVGTKVFVVGDGKLGLLCAMALRSASDDVTVIGKHEDKLSRVSDLGIRTVNILGSEDLPSEKADIIVEASGSPTGFATAVDLVRPRGKIVLKSTFHGDLVWPTTRIVVDEISVIGSRCGKLQRAIDALANNSIPVERLIDAEYPLAQGIEALKAAEAKGVLKVLLRPQPISE